MPITLTDSEVQGLARFQRLLLDPFGFPDVEGWGRTCAEAWRQLVGADLAGINVPLEEGLQAFNTDAALDVALAEYAEYFWQIDEGLQGRRLALENPTVVHEADLFESRELPHDEVFVDWRIPHRLYEPLAIVIDREAMVPPILVAYRGTDDRRHLLESKRTLAHLVAPCFESAVGFWFRMHRYRGELERMLRESAGALGLFDGRGDLRHANAAGRRLLAEQRLGPRLAQVSRRMVHGLMDRSNPVTKGTHEVAGIRVQAFLIPPGVAALEPMALVEFDDRRESFPDPRQVAQQHGLTPRQADVALLMAQRLTHKEIARRLRIRPNTARRHCQAVLDRLGVHSRQEVRSRLLARQAARGVSGMSDAPPPQAR